MRMFHRSGGNDGWARAALILAVFVLGFVEVFSAIPVSATSLEAQQVVIPGVGLPVAITGNLYEETSKKIDGFFKTLVMGGITTMFNAVQSITQRIAHDAAQRILTGDNGQFPMFYEKGFGKYMEDVGRSTLDQGISDINENFTKSFGIDLCEPVDPLKLSLGLKLPLQEPGQLQPKCTTAKIANAFEQTKASFNSVKDVNDVIAVQFDPNASDLGVSLGVQNKLIGAKLNATEAAKQDRLEGGGVKAKVDPITGLIQTPAAAFTAVIQDKDYRDPDAKTRDEMTRSIYTNAFEMGFAQVGMLTAETFLTPLITGGLQRLFDGLKPSSPADLVNVDLVNAEAAVNRNVASARIVLSDMLTPNLFTTDKQDFVIELSTCPTPRGIWNCAMDDALATALRTQGDSGAYTVGQAAQLTVNGEAPSNPAFLHQEWELIPDAEAKDNTDPTCYQHAYCASNLAKLRYARVLPVGWEMAANSPFNQKRNGKYVTLGEVMRGFSSCNANGESDSAHPWCKLIDPNWVLTAPPFQCRVKGYGDTVFGGTGLRIQECADAASCLTRDDKGNCTGGYGYCLAEKPVWRFSADVCLERFASCRTYATRGGEQVSYLRNSIDYGSCSAENVGCMWFASLRNPKDISGRAWDSSSKVYFDASIKTCPSSADGCTKLLKVALGQSALNLVPNGSFEQGGTEDSPDAISIWNIDAGAAVVNNDAADNGVRSLKFTGPGNEMSPGIAVVPSRSYTLTLRARPAATSTQGGFSATLHLVTKTGAPVAAANVYRSTSCSVNSGSTVGFDETVPADEAGAWTSYLCTFTSNIDVASSTLVLNGDNILIDTIQLEEGERPTPFIDGEATDLAEVHLRMPPDELGCTGSTLDNPLCKNYARMCRQTDAGCQAYSDRDNPYAPKIPATLSAADYCPQSCVGYAEYVKQPSTFDLGHSVNPLLDDPEDQSSVDFIPSTAKQCTIQDVGCEEFTNVQAAAAGGEATAHFNYVQLCEKPSDNTETYFTWEGSDTTGYQLRTWSLIHDPLTNPARPKLVLKLGPNGTLKDPANCNDVSWKNGTDPDCRQMFNANGDVMYVYMTQTVLSTPTCTDFRKNLSNVADCEKTGGSFTPATGECIYHVEPTRSFTCNAAATGCRAYLGATGRNTTVVVEENFNSSNTLPFTFSQQTSGARSNEAILVGDQSLKLTGQAPLLAQTDVPLFRNQTYRMSFWAKSTVPGQAASTLVVDGKPIGTFSLSADWQRFELGPFSVSPNGPTSTVVWSNLPNPTFIDQIRIERVADVTFVVKDSWQTPTECDQTLEGLPQPQAMLGCRAYTDPDGNGFAVRQFAHLCQESAIGCTAYVDTRNTKSAYAETTNVSGAASSSKVTLVAKQWDDKYIGDWQANHPADRYVYAINDPSMRCDAAQDSCRAFGKPNLSASTLDVGSVQLTGDQAKALGGPNATSVSIGDYQTVYFLDDTSQYVDGSGEPNMLCRKDELFCNEFKSGKTIAYFRNPMQHACEWRDKVQLKADPANQIPADGSYSGWFRKGSDAPCYPELLSTGNSYLLQNAGDPTYQGWVGTCPVEQSECTEFRDPNDHSDPLHRAGKPYFFIKNQRLDVTSCNGSVDLLKGCVLFRDVTDPRSRYSTAASYATYHEKGDTAQAPVDCVADPQNPSCLSHKSCSAVKLAACSGNGCIEPKVAFPNCVVPSCQDPNSFECQQAIKYGGCTGIDTVEKLTGASCQTDADCMVTATNGNSSYTVTGSCGAQNDANILMKVKLDRDCSQWLGCATAESVYDPVQQKYVEVCTQTATCDVSKGANAGSFCASYVDRSKEPVLKPGVFFDGSVYVKRPIGFGEPDYTGYAVPDQFQAADLQNRLVGKELFFKDSLTANKFATDYRLVAAVSEQTGLVTFPQNENVPVNPLYPNLLICKDTQTGRTGYFIKGTPVGRRVCYFAIDSLATRSASIAVQGPNQTSDPRNIEPLSDAMRQTTDPLNDVALQQALPPSECKSYPEGNAPFPNLYVKTWDTTIQPPKAKKIVDGYESATLCEFGEQCACSYRRVKYGNGEAAKYYSPFGQSPVAGLCSGGPNDGQACVPGEKTVVGTSGLSTQSTTEDVGCPGGGRCLAITDVVLVRGQSGQCLERDDARSVANDTGRHPCLVWNPNPILAGPQDLAHFNPTAGYMPPVNAGEYYCLSKANPPIETVWSAESHTSAANSRDRWDDNPFFFLPGALAKFNYDQGYVAGFCHNADECGEDDFVAGGSCNCADGSGQGGAASGLDVDFKELVRDPNTADIVENQCASVSAGSVFGAETFIIKNSVPFKDKLVSPFACLDQNRFVNLGQGIDGVKPWTGGEAESSQAVRCMLATTDPDPDIKAGILPFSRAPFMDNNRGRWIQTGRGVSRTYMEYFVPVKPAGVASWLLSGAPATDAAAKQATFERNFSQFQFFPVNDQYAAACSLPPEYVDNVSVQDWSDVQQVGAASNQVFTALNKDFDGMLDRSKENIVVDKTNGRPIKEACSGMNDGAVPTEYADADGKCYMKYWETDYRMEGASKFEWLDNEQGESFWDRHKRYYSHERTCSKSGFAIRAMFELADKTQNGIADTLVSKDQLTGPWKFIGFWITACKTGDNYESSLYLSLRVKHADVCTDIGEVISPYSRENAAFADRVWAGGGFIIPQLGFSFTTQYSPFGSALATGIPGKEPLFQTNGPVENWSALKPPTFIGSGASYVSTADSPAYRWGHLTNIFARVYRVYHFNDAAVGKNSSVCIGGPSQGRVCPSPPSAAVNSPEYIAWKTQTDALCGTKGNCNTTLVSDAQKSILHICNGLSGLNAGLTCGEGKALPSLDPVCHNAAMKHMPGGSYEPQLTSCAMRPGWKICPNGLYSNGDCTVNAYSAKTAHEQYNAFGCAGDAVVPAIGCTKPETKSVDCPLKVTNVPCIKDDTGPMAGHCGNGYEHARCSQNVQDANTPNPTPSTDCVFTWAQWWGAYDDGVPKDPNLLPQYSGENPIWLQADKEVDIRAAAETANPDNPWIGTLSLISYIYPTNGGARYGTFLPTADATPGGYEGTTWDPNNPAMGFVPPFGGSDMRNIPRGKFSSAYFGAYPFAAYTRHGGVVFLDYSTPIAERYPAPHPIYDEAVGNDAVVQPGLCEGAAGSLMDPNKVVPQGGDIRWIFGGPNAATAPGAAAAYAKYAFQFGQCEGGAYDAQVCYSSTNASKLADASSAWANSLPSCWTTSNVGGACQKVATVAADGTQIPIGACLNAAGGDAFTDDPDADNNICTHSSGYTPRLDVCGTQSNEKCLTGYDLAGAKKQQSLDYSTQQPTDVTSGFHKPSFLGLDPAKVNPAKEAYIGFYAPRPPTVAAPDLAHACQAPGQCKIAQVGAFTLENQSAGSIFYAGGKAQISMKFYAWAEHDQGPLKSLFIDWGDGSRTTIDNARMKNKKPFCGGLGECELIPGLTCQSDADCPAAGGKCAERGSCTQNPTKSCFRNGDCQAAGNPTDTCKPRLFFGNTDDACEANYFEFSHAYSCNPTTMPSCKDGNGNEILRCSNNPDLPCTTAAQCGSGDTCVAGLAPTGAEGSIGGCYDPDKVACRYTPKLLLEDNWNWCTGECRKGPLVGGQPTDVTAGLNQSAVRHVYGGCWDGTETKMNTDVSANAPTIMLTSQNECQKGTIDDVARKTIRPWVVYQGAVQIGIFQ